MIGRGVQVGEVTAVEAVKYAEVSDPDGNVWLLQQLPAEMRQPGQSFYGE